MRTEPWLQYRNLRYENRANFKIYACWKKLVSIDLVEILDNQIEIGKLLLTAGIADLSSSTGDT